MGLEGLAELAKFVQEGGTLITEGSTSTILPEYGISNGVTVEEPAQLFVRGSILRGRIADPKSPIVYGFAGDELPVYFSSGAGAERPADEADRLQPLKVRMPALARTSHQTRRRSGCRCSMAIRPRPTRLPAPGERPREEDVARLRQQAVGDVTAETSRPRVVMRFPDNPNDLLLSGTIANGQHSSGRAIAVATKKIGLRSRRDVRDPPVLAMADTGNLHARLQRDHLNW